METEYDEEWTVAVLYSPGHRWNWNRRNWLDKQKEINCSLCPYHLGENNTRRKRDPHDKRIPWKEARRICGRLV